MLMMVVLKRNLSWMNKAHRFGPQDIKLLVYIGLIIN